MKRKILSLILSILTLSSIATGEFRPAGGRWAGMGFCGVAVADPWSVQNNPAGLGFLNGFTAGAYCENRFLLKELMYGEIASCLAFRPVTVGLSFSRFGGNLVSEAKAGLAFGRKFGSRLSAGVKFDYIRLQQLEPYSSRDLLTVEAGLMFRADKSWSAGIHIVNPVPARYSQTWCCRLPVVIRFGTAYEWYRKVLVTAEFEQELNGTPCIRAGLEYRLAARFCGRLGFQSNPATVTGGVGFECGNWSVDLGSSWQSMLGYSPQVSIGYRISK